MPDNKWINDMFDKDDREKREKAEAEAAELERARRFRALLPTYLPRFVTALREAVTAFNAGLAKQGRMHAVQINERRNGIELVALEVPDYAVLVNDDARHIEYGWITESGLFRGGASAIDLYVADNQIMASAQKGAGSEVQQTLHEYFETARKAIK